MDDKLGYGINLWGTNSNSFLKESDIINILINTDKFDFIDLNTLSKKVDLTPGDLLIREGHVDFFVNDNAVISWGRVHKKYLISKSFKHDKSNNFYYSNNSEDLNIPYKIIIKIRSAN